MKKILFALLFLCGHALAICSPFGATGVVQMFNNNGVPIPNGVIYSYAAGTSTQQASFTDSTCLVANNNPITLTSGGRANIWLNGAQFYKFVACLQNDGASCSPADVLFSVDNVPGGPQGVGSPFVGTFISGSANPASTGILELASIDSICWRNQANTVNLCITKDTSDVLGWNGGDVKFTETTCSATAAGFDYLCADNSLHRWTMFNNGGTKTQIVGAGVDINNSDQVIQWHFGAQATPLSGVALVSGQPLIWNGTNIVGWVTVSGTPTNGQVLTATSGTAATWSTPNNAILSHNTQTTFSNTAIGNANTTVFSKAVTMPAVGCPCRAVAYWWTMATTGTAGVVDAYVSDGTNGFAGYETANTGSFSSGWGFNGAGSSPVTYANSAPITFTLIMATTDSGGVTLRGTAGSAITGMPTAQLVIDIVPSN